MASKGFLSLIRSVTVFLIISLLMGSCAQVGMPTGGPRDSIPPVLVSAVPKMFQTNFKSDKISR